MEPILALVAQETRLDFRRATDTGEYCGPCPFCGQGVDRFRIWTAENRFWCRRCEAGGDAIEFLRRYRNVGYGAAREILERGPLLSQAPLLYKHNDHKRHNDHKHHNSHQGSQVKTAQMTPPAAGWLEPAWRFVFACSSCVWDDENPRPLAWLRQRMLSDDILGKHGLGYNDEDHTLERAAWGLPTQKGRNGRPARLWLPRGITIPWLVDGELWGIRIRRPTGAPKYYWIPGGTLGLYNGDRIQAGQPVVLVEGEMDALTVVQETGGTVAAVATGSTHGARHIRWLARLATASIVLVAFDADPPGEQAAAWWLDALTNARRWRPYWADANAMAQDGANIGDWIQAGLQTVGQAGAAARQSEVTP